MFSGGIWPSRRRIADGKTYIEQGSAPNLIPATFLGFDEDFWWRKFVLSIGVKLGIGWVTFTFVENSVL